MPYSLTENSQVTINQVLDARWKRERSDEEKERFSNQLRYGVEDKETKQLEYVFDKSLIQYKCEISMSERPGDVSIKWIDASRLTFSL